MNRLVQGARNSQKSFSSQANDAKKIAQALALNANFAAVKQAILGVGLAANQIPHLGGETFLALAVRTLNKFVGCDLALLTAYGISPIGWKATKNQLGIVVNCSHYEFRLAAFLVAATIDFTPTIEGRKLQLSKFFADYAAENQADILAVFQTLIDLKVKKAAYNQASYGLHPKLANFINKSAPEPIRDDLLRYAHKQVVDLETVPLQQVKDKLTEDLAKVYATEAFEEVINEITALRAKASTYLTSANTFKLHSPIDFQLHEAVTKK